MKFFNGEILEYRDETSDKIWGYCILGHNNSYFIVGDKIEYTQSVVFWGRRGSKLSTKICRTTEAEEVCTKKVRKGYKFKTYSVLLTPSIISDDFEEHLEATYNMALMKI